MKKMSAARKSFVFFGGGGAAPSAAPITTGLKIPKPVNQKI